MSPRVMPVRCANIREIISEAVRLGAPAEGIDNLASRAMFRAIRIEGLPSSETGLAYREMTAAGGTAVASATADEDANDVLLFGTYDQYRKLIATMASAGATARSVAARLRDVLLFIEGSAPPPPIATARGAIEFGARTLIMGILNTTPDSFYDGGRRPTLEASVAHGLRLIREGADVLDIGGESTRPGASQVDALEEIHRVVPVIERIRAEEAQVLISIDTMKAAVAKAALDAGADIVNDVSSLRADSDMAALCAARKVPVCLMHMKGSPETMQRDPAYRVDVVFEIMAFLSSRIRAATEAGIAVENILVDPGIGFGKTLDHNLEILRRIEELVGLGRPVVVGASRKRFIGELTQTEPEHRLEGSLAASVLSAAGGAHVVRVHDVAATRKALAVADAALRHPRMVRKNGS